MKRSSKLCFTLLAVALSGSVSASNIYTTPDPAIITSPGTTVDVSIVIEADGVVNGFAGALQYDGTQFTVSNFAPCSNPAPGFITFSDTNGGSPYASDTTVCTPTFTYTGTLPGPADPDVVSALTFTALDDGQGLATGDPGELRVQGVPPTTQTVTATAGAGGSVAPATQNVASGSTAVVTVTPDPGFEVTAIGGTCGGTPVPALPSNVAVTYTTNPVGTAGDPDNSADCTVTATFGAIPAPIYASTPAPGSTRNCASGGTTSVNIQNTGDLVLNVSCSIAAPFSSAGPSATIAPGGNSDVTVTCPTVADGDPPVNGTLVCSSDGGPDASYPVIASAIPPVPPAIPAPNLVPASSLWSKLMLFGFLAGLGALVISLRRS